MDYPILTACDSTNEIVTPQSFATHAPDAFKEVENVKLKGIHRAYLVFYDDYKNDNEFLKQLKVVFLFHAASNVSKVYEYKDALIAIAPLGGPAAAAIMEELSVFGIDEFVAIGSAGCLDENLKDKLIVVQKAIRDEGLSYHYLKPSTYVATNEELSQKLEKFLTENRLEYKKSITWTTDAYYRETDQKVKMAKDLGAISVEMECASWCAVAQYRGFKFAQILYFSDIVKQSGWERYVKLAKDYKTEKGDMILALVKDMIDKNL